MSLSDWIRMAADIGLDGTEIYCRHLKTMDRPFLEQVADEVERAGLQVSMFTSYGQLATPSEEERLRQIASLRDDVDRAVLLRTDIVRMTAGKWPTECTREEALRSAADCLKRSLDYAEENGVRLALEDHPQVGTSVKDFVEILALVDDHRLRVNLDTGNPMRAGDSPVELTGLVKERVVHVHAKDRTQQIEDMVMGEGCVPFAEIFTILKSADFDGWISLEGGGTKEGIVKGIRYVRELWRTV
jgi:sugar phosphate isomerase/epimerase